MFYTDDVQADYERMKARGAEFTVPPTDVTASRIVTVVGVLAATNDGADLATTYKGLVVIGYDAGKAQKDAVRRGLFLGSVTQDPYQIGFKAVELAYKAFKGETVANVDTGAKFYDKSNMDQKDIAILLYD